MFLDMNLWFMRIFAYDNKQSFFWRNIVIQLHPHCQPVLLRSIVLLQWDC